MSSRFGQFCHDEAKDQSLASADTDDHSSQIISIERFLIKLANRFVAGTECYLCKLVFAKAMQIRMVRETW